MSTDSRISELAIKALASGDENKIEIASKAISGVCGVAFYNFDFGPELVPARLHLLSVLSPVRAYDHPLGLTDEDGNVIQKYEPDCPELDAWAADKRGWK